MPSDELVSMDPGGQKSGIAVWRENRLFWAGLAWNTDLPGGLVTVVEPTARWIAEKPQLYRVRRVKTSGVDGLLRTLRMVRERWPGPWIEVFPRVWKRQVPKGIHNDRVLARLAEDERVRIPDDHNVIDAVGIGLWLLTKEGKRLISKRTT